MKRLLALVLTLLLLLSCAQAEALPATVTATGTASITLEADVVVLTLRVNAYGETLADAEVSAETELTTLLAALTGAGVEEEEIQTTRSDVQNVTEYQFNKLKEKEQTTVGCSIEYIVTVTLSDMTQLAAVVDAAVLSGAYSTYTVTLNSTRREEAYREALALATQQAMLNARALASACGHAEAGVVSVVELPRPEAAELVVTAQVEVTLGVQ